MAEMNQFMVCFDSFQRNLLQKKPKLIETRSLRFSVVPALEPITRGGNKEVWRDQTCLLRVGGGGRRGVEPGVAAGPGEGEGGADGELRRQAGHGDGVHGVVVVRVR